MIRRIPLPNTLNECPQPWINFIEHCHDTVPNDTDIERYVDRVLLERYLSVIDDEKECVVIFTDDSLYAQFLLEWS